MGSSHYSPGDRVRFIRQAGSGSGYINIDRARFGLSMDGTVVGVSYRSSYVEAGVPFVLWDQPYPEEHRKGYQNWGLYYPIGYAITGDVVVERIP